MKFYILSIIGLLWSSSLQGQHRQLDSLKNKLREATDERSRYKYLIQIALESRKTDLDTSLAYCKKALKLSSENHWKADQAEALNFLGVNYAIQGNYDTAQFNMFEALKIFETLNDQQGLGKTYNNLSGVMINSGSPEKAAPYLDKSIKIWQALGDSVRIADGYMARAILFRSDKDYGQALRYLDDALVLYRNKNATERIGQIYFNLGYVQQDLNQLGDALASYRRAINIHSIVGKYLVPELYRLVGQIHIKLKAYDSARYYLEKSVQLAEAQNLKNEEFESFQSLSELYKTMGDYKSALFYFEKYDEIEQEVFSREKAEQLQKIQTRFETRQKDQQLKLNESLIKKQQVMITASAIGVLLLIIILLLLVNFYQEKSKSHKQLSILNRDIREKSEEIFTQSEELLLMNMKMKAVNEDLERLMEERTGKIQDQNEKLREYSFINGHKVRGPLARIMGLIHLYKEHKVDVHELFHRLDESAIELDVVVKEINSALGEEKE